MDGGYIMTFQSILDELLLLAEAILPIAGQPEYAALLAIIVPRIDALIAKIGVDLGQTAAWTPEQQAAFQARIDAIKNDPAWQVTP